jgi:hypothetical protein
MGNCISKITNSDGLLCSQPTGKLVPELPAGWVWGLEAPWWVVHRCSAAGSGYPGAGEDQRHSSARIIMRYGETTTCAENQAWGTSFTRESINTQAIGQHSAANSTSAAALQHLQQLRVSNTPQQCAAFHTVIVLPLPLREHATSARNWSLPYLLDTWTLDRKCRMPSMHGSRKQGRQNVRRQRLQRRSGRASARKR